MATVKQRLQAYYASDSLLFTAVGILGKLAFELGVVAVFWIWLFLLPFAVPAYTYSTSVEPTSIFVTYGSVTLTTFFATWCASGISRQARRADGSSRTTGSGSGESSRSRR